jgi:peptidoglycan-associated lipoprotein
MLRKKTTGIIIMATFMVFFSIAFGIEESDAGDRMERNRFEYEDVYFKYRSIKISPQAAEVLKRKAEWLKNNPDVTVILEGHTDERNRREANIAFGERRAGAVKTYMIKLGVEGSRMKVVSYGEEAPMDSGHNEEAWAKNRRVRFKIEQNN